MKATGSGLALVGDPDQSFLDQITRDSKALSLETDVAASQAELEARLAASPGRYSAIFVNPRLAEPCGIPLVRAIRAACPATPVYLIAEGGQALPPPGEYGRLTVRDVLLKPLNFTAIHEALSSDPAFDAKAALALAAGPAEELDRELDDSDSAFVPIRARSFIAGRESYFDIYVRIREHRYMKILAAGDAFEPSRVGGYILKGIEQFYLRHRAQEAYLRYCDALTTAVLAQPAVPAEVKVSQLLSWGEETSSFLRAGGLNEGAVQYARRFARSVQGLVHGLKLDQVDLVQRHLNTTPHFDHTAACVMIASLLAIPLKFDSERSASIVGLAALLHDIGMQKLPKELALKPEEQMTPEELKLYYQHPLIGQEMLRELPGIEPVVLQAVAQHHERRTGRGFPFGLGPSQITLVAEIIALSEELVRQMEAAAKQPGMNIYAELEKRCADGFSASVFSTLRLFLR